VEGQQVEVYHTHQKIAEPDYGEVYGMAVTMTYGLYELFAFPYESFRVVRHTLLGRDVRVTYDANGSVMKIELDGHDTAKNAFIP
jgi:hypothetical protein